MSGSISAFVYCDYPACGAHCPSDESCRTVADARGEARADGWHRTSSGKDICPDCWDAGVREVDCD